MEAARQAKGSRRGADAAQSQSTGLKSRAPMPASVARSASGTASAEGAPATHAAVLQPFRTVLTAFKSHFQHVERKAGIGGTSLWARSIIREQGGIGVGHLAAALGVRQPTASIIVRNLSLQGLVEPSREGPDRRSVQLTITPEGHKLLRRAPGPLPAFCPKHCRLWALRR